MTEAGNNNTKDDSAEDLYQDLPVFQFDEQLIKLEKDSKEFKEEASLLTIKVKELTEENTRLQKDCDVLLHNISALEKTARSEIERKTNIINELRRELDSIKFRRNKKITRDQCTNTEFIEIQNDANEVKKTFEGRRWEHVTSNGRHSVSSASSGSKLSEYDEEKMRYHSKERIKECVDIKKENYYQEKSKSRERDERIDTDKGRKLDRGREDESFRRRNFKEENSYSRSRYDKFHESHRNRGKASKKYGLRYRSRNGSPHRVESYYNSKHHPNELRRRSRDRRPERRSSSQDRRRRSSDRRKSRERYKCETDTNRDYTNDKKREENIKCENPFVEKRKSKKLREDNITLKIEKNKTGDSDVKKDLPLEIKKSGQEKNKDSDKISARENKCSIDNRNEADNKKDTRTESDSNLEEKNTSKPRNKIDFNEYIRRKPSSTGSDKDNKKNSFDTPSALAILCNEMERSEESSKVKNGGCDVDDSDDYGEDWAFSFKNERPVVTTPKTLYTKRMEKKILGIAPSVQKKVNEVSSPDDESKLKENGITQINLEEKNLLKNQLENLVGTTLDCPEKTKVEGVHDQPIKVPKLKEEKEPGELTDDESDENTKKTSSVINVLNNSNDLKEKQSSEMIATDNSSGMDIMLELPKTPDIRESQNNSLLNDAIVNLNKSDEILQRVEDHVGDKSSQSNLEPTNEIIGDQTMNDMMENLFEEQKVSNLLEEFSPLKNNYRLIKISPLKTFEPGRNSEIRELLKKLEASKLFEELQVNSTIDHVQENGTITTEQVKENIMTTAGNIIENSTTTAEIIKEVSTITTALQHFDTPKKSNFCNQEPSIQLDQNSSGNNLSNEQLESSLDLTIETSKELDSDERKTEECRLGANASLKVNKNDLVIENISNGDVKPKPNRKRTSSRTNRASSKKKDTKKSDKKLVNEKDRDDFASEKNITDVNKLNEIKEVSGNIQKLSVERRSSQKRESCRKKKSPNEVPEISTRSLRARKSKSKEPSEEKILVKEESRARKSTPSRNSKRKREDSVEKLNSETKESNKRKKTDNKNYETGRKNNKKAENASIFSPLPNITNPMELMTPRRMLKNDLMLTDSEDETPVKRKAAETVQFVETVEQVEAMEHVETAEHIETVKHVEYVENTENMVNMENTRNVESEELSNGSSSESDDFSDSGASDFLDLL